MAAVTRLTMAHRGGETSSAPVWEPFSLTGAGRGIGEALARYFAAEGARVVVNDLGVAIDGTAAAVSVAEAVAASIRGRGDREQR